MTETESPRGKAAMTDLFLVAKKERPMAAAPGLVPDWQARESALDVRQSWIVEAPAGSGKTGLLIQRYLKLLADESVEQPEQVLAITFTVKATAELRERVTAQLEAAERGDALQAESPFDRATRELAHAVMSRDKQLRWQLLEHPRRLKIRTIDSVSGEIVRMLPVLSGGGGRLTPVDHPATMYREAARQTLMQLGGKDASLNEALRTVLLHRDGSLAECENLLMEMLPLRNQWGALVPLLGGDGIGEESLDLEVLPQLQRALDEVVCAGLAEFAQAVPAQFLGALATLAAELAHSEPYGRDKSPIIACIEKIGIPSIGVADLEHWRALIHLMVTPSSGTWRKSFAKNTLGFEMTPQQKSELRRLLDQVSGRVDLLEAMEKVNRLPPVVYPEEQWAVAKALFRVLSRAQAELKVVFARRGECDFAEWGLLAKSVLREDGAMEHFYTALGMKLQHLLVDEMQDTSTSQYELIELLTQGWDGHSQTVFLVGDPKQSIYLFRQARVERFVHTMRTGMLGDLPLGLLRLTANFRSQRQLVEAFNEDFSLLFPPEVNASRPEDVPYVRAHPARESSNSAAKSTVWHTDLLATREMPREDKARMKHQSSKKQASEVRRIVEDWQNRPLPDDRAEPWKIAVLVRSRNVLPEIVAELKDTTRGAIAFRAVDIEPLGERQEVLDLLALTRALRHPADRVAWFAVLHAPWCGLGLADLHLLAGADDHRWAERCVEDLIVERGELLTEESRARLARVWPVLHAARESRRRITTAQQVERTWKSLGGDRYLEASQLANAKRFFQLFDESEDWEGSVDLGLLQERLTKLFAEPAVGVGMVDLMTIHGAKGLEWDVVIVPGLEKRAQAERPRLLAWNEVGSPNQAAARIVLAPIAGRGEASKELNDWLRCVGREREAAERKRLFYVACTRAREELHLFASPEMTSKGEISQGYGSLLAAAWPAAERHFAATMSASAQVGPIRSVPKVFVRSLEDEVQSNGKEFVGDIAALAADDQKNVRPAMLKRVPISFNPRARFGLKIKPPDGSDRAESGMMRLPRPEGSFEARAFGNAVHAFLELLAQRLAVGEKVDPLLQEISRWSQRIAAVLRTNGLAPSAIARMTERVKSALTNALLDQEGRWLLEKREQGSSEFALTSREDKFGTLRMDRVFVAGERPLSEGSDFVWIIDYKTTTHGSLGVDDFLAGERVKYSPQLEAYALQMQAYAGVRKVRIGLYYPMLPRFVWWEG